MSRDIKNKKHSVTIAGHRTSIMLEQPFWDVLNKIAQVKSVPISVLISEIDNDRESHNLSSSIRLYILQYFLEKNDF